MARKKGRKTVLAQERFQRGGTIDFAPERLFRQPVKAHDLLQQRPESRVEQITSLGEQRRQRVPVVLQPALRVVHRKAHLRFLPADAQFAEQPHEARIGAVVVDDKTGIDGKAALRRVDIHRCGMAARRGLRLKQRDLVMSGEPPGTG